MYLNPSPLFCLTFIFAKTWQRQLCALLRAENGQAIVDECDTRCHDGPAQRPFRFPGSDHGAAAAVCVRSIQR